MRASHAAELFGHFAIRLPTSNNTKQSNHPTEMPLLRLTSSILKATVDSPTALNMLTKSLSANLAAMHPHKQHRPKEQLKDRRVPEPTRTVPIKDSVRP